jgi:hypothetical protein
MRENCEKKSKGSKGKEARIVSAAGADSLLVTGQQFTSRFFMLNEGVVDKKIRAAAEAFCDGANKQIRELLRSPGPDVSPEGLESAQDFMRSGGAKAVEGGEGAYLVNLEKWPDEVAFGPWFKSAMMKHGVYIED